jgi:hypothetical protein
MIKSALRILTTLLVLLHSASAFAQSEGDRFELGAQLAVIKSSEFDTADVGFGARFSWRPVGVVGLESEFTYYPNGFPSLLPFSHARLEGLFGATVGPRISRVRPFAKGGAGFLNVRARSEPFICILIFPPPLACELAGGRTLPAFDIGGGFEVFPTDGTFIRFEVSDRVLEYPGPALTRRGTVRDRSFFSHDLRVAGGAGIRF